MCTVISWYDLKTFLGHLMVRQKKNGFINVLKIVSINEPKKLWAHDLGLESMVES